MCQFYFMFEVMSFSVAVDNFSYRLVYHLPAFRLSFALEHLVELSASCTSSIKLSTENLRRLCTFDMDFEITSHFYVLTCLYVCLFHCRRMREAKT